MEYVIDLPSSAPGSFNYPRAVVIVDYVKVPQILKDKCNGLARLAILILFLSLED